MSNRPDFSKVRLKPGELQMLQFAYAETYPVRPLINHAEELGDALYALYVGDYSKRSEAAVREDARRALVNWGLLDGAPSSGSGGA